MAGSFDGVSRELEVNKRPFQANYYKVFMCRQQTRERNTFTISLSVFETVERRNNRMHECLSSHE